MILNFCSFSFFFWGEIVFFSSNHWLFMAGYDVFLSYTLINTTNYTKKIQIIKNNCFSILLYFSIPFCTWYLFIIDVFAKSILYWNNEFTSRFGYAISSILYFGKYDIISFGYLNNVDYMKYCVKKNKAE